MNDFTMRGIPASLIDQLWHYAEPYLKRALDHTSGEVAVADIKQACLNRDVQLWLISRGTRVVAAITTEIVNYPHRKHCRVITLAGSDLASWLELADNTLCTWATEQGCDALESFVRKGLVPKLAPLAYKHKHSVLIKELNNV